jgi:hypothetical protein
MIGTAGIEEAPILGDGLPAAPPAGADPLVRLIQRQPAPVLDLTDFKRDLSELTDRLGHAQDCL